MADFNRRTAVLVVKTGSSFLMFNAAPCSRFADMALDYFPTSRQEKVYKDRSDPESRREIR